MLDICLPSWGNRHHLCQRTVSFKKEVGTACERKIKTKAEKYCYVHGFGQVTTMLNNALRLVLLMCSRYYPSEFSTSMFFKYEQLNRDTLCGF